MTETNDIRQRISEDVRQRISEDVRQRISEDVRQRAVFRETRHRYFEETEKRHEMLFAPYNVNFPVFRVLSYLLLNPDNMTPSQIADDLMILRQSMTNILDSLEKRDLVCREIDPADRRRIRVKLLPAGEALSAELLHLEDSYLVKMGKYISDEERQAFRVLDRKMYEAKVSALSDILREREA